ncbi:MAG: hypothetical protein A2W91_06885 [Bacteroidetes bacterium GWF2_38_335]|nr:MAG: hypothetical protein A2W91_06885 [Bacteroidetes bacterium GWF2_38_335]OFY80897.1 MAG: hypothetical protein A2281_04820 [Bacteroidetes bacterium RIFOXYA12_FULL_38_20]HBS84942.1 prephenate dehydrogenase [Bacteroidales bacterium]
MKREKNIIGIAGLGLMGCSLAISLKKSGFAAKIMGWDINPTHSSAAISLGYADAIVHPANMPQCCDLIVIAVPVNHIPDLLKQVLDRCTNQVVTDLGSAKHEIEYLLENHPNRSRYVASHPMAGTEKSGPDAAIPNLFTHKTAIICNKEKSDSDALTLVSGMYKSLEMQIVYMDSESHDYGCGLISHLSHVCAYALALSVLEKSVDKETISVLAGGGFKSTVRIAASSPDMWVPIFMQNQKNLIAGIETCIEKMCAFKNAIQSGNSEKCRELISSANTIEDYLAPNNSPPMEGSGVGIPSLGGVGGGSTHPQPLQRRGVAQFS